MPPMIFHARYAYRLIMPRHFADADAPLPVFMRYDTMTLLHAITLYAVQRAMRDRDARRQPRGDEV